MEQPKAQIFTAEVAKKAADYRNSHEYQFEMIMKGIEKFAMGQTGYQNPKGEYKITFKRLRPEFKTKLEEMGYVVTDTTTTVPKTDKAGKKFDEVVESSEVRWGEETKMEVVK